MNPPLRSARDREAILEGLADGTIEILCSDHAPHCDYEKEVEFDYAPFGITGLETELALSLMQLVHTKRLSLADLIAKFTVNPARLLNLNKGTLAVGADADVTVFDPDAEWVFTRGTFGEQIEEQPVLRLASERQSGGDHCRRQNAGSILISNSNRRPGGASRLNSRPS